jgi:alcohol dehydrogenase, propanol-preferring
MPLTLVQAWLDRAFRGPRAYSLGVRAMVLRNPGPAGEGPLRPEMLADASPGPGEIALSVIACAVCRTDLQLVEGDLKARRLPVVPGHQAVGAIEEVGEGVAGWKTGDLAGIGWLGGACGGCNLCRSGRENLCSDTVFTGWDRDGGYAERLVARANFAFRLPAGLEPEAAAPLLCGGVIGYRSLRRSGIQPGGRLGLFGYGASAHLTIQVALHWGCEVYVCTRSSREQERARRAGATWAGGYDEPPPAPLDAAITFAPAGEVVISALTALGKGGAVAVNAIHLDRVPAFPYELLWWERELRSVANFTRDDAKEFLQLAAEIPVRTDIEVLPMDAANDALRRLADGSLGATAVLVPSWR